VLPKKTGEPARLISPLQAMRVSIILGPLGVIIGQKKPIPTEQKFVSTGAGQQGVLDVREAVAASMAGPREIAGSAKDRGCIIIIQMARKIKNGIRNELCGSVKQPVTRKVATCTSRFISAKKSC
jgi:hypothetical protein